MILTIEAKDAAEMREKIVGLAELFNTGRIAPTVERLIPNQSIRPEGNSAPCLSSDQSPSESKTETQSSFETSSLEALPETPTPKTKRGRKAKAAAAEVLPNIESETEVQPPLPTFTSPEGEEVEDVAAVSIPTPPSLEITREHIVAALMEVNTKLGLDAAKQVLSKLGHQRISEVKESEFGAFIAICNDVLKV